VEESKISKMGAYRLLAPNLACFSNNNNEDLNGVKIRVYGAFYGPFRP